MNSKKNIFWILSLVFLAGAIALSPSFNFGALSDGKIIEIRIEDILILILGFIWIGSLVFFKIKKIEKPPLFLPILVWVGVGFLSTLINWIFSELSLSRGFFYFLKEFQFFIFYFYVFFNIKTLRNAKIVIGSWFFLVFVNVLYLIYQIFSGNHKGEYALAAVGEWGVFPTGFLFLLFFIFLFNIFLYYILYSKISVSKKIGIGALAFSPLLGAFGSGSQTVFLAVALSFFLTIFLFFLKKKKINFFVIFIVLIILALAIFIFDLMVSNIIEIARIKQVLSFEKIIDLYFLKRFDDVIKPVFLTFYKDITILDVIIGRGKGYLGECHSQYLRNFIETGIIGFFSFLFLIAIILKKLFISFIKGTKGLSVGLSSGLLIATFILLFFSFGTEPFITVKPISVYWFFAGITMAVLKLENN